MKMKIKHILTIPLALSLLALAAKANNDIKIDADFPGGNIIVLDMKGDTVHLRQDLRDTKGNWFYWSFRIRGAQGRTLEFSFGKENIVSHFGPAISVDSGKTWRWPNSKPSAAPTASFTHTFGLDEKEVFFSLAPNYTEKELKIFLETHKGNPALKVGTLCKTNKGRGAELLCISENKNAPYKALFTARHHACETMASYALEGIMMVALSDTPDGRWLRENIDFMIVPFVDKDGVEDGDQGKHRKPHDHNRDYIMEIHPTIRAIKKQVPEWLDGRPAVFFDLHCPTCNGKTTYFYTHKDDSLLANNMKRFSAILEEERKGPIPYKESANRALAPTKASYLSKSSDWASSLPTPLLVAALEIPYSNSAGVAVTAESSRLLGKDMARALKLFLETQK